MGGRRGGGILIYTKKELCARSVPVETAFNQVATIKIKGSKDDISIHVIYRSPNSTKQNDDDLCKWIKGLKGQFIAIGDFNFLGIDDWEKGRSDAKA